MKRWHDGERRVGHLKGKTKTSLVLILLLGSIFFPIIASVRGTDTHDLTVTLNSMFFQNHLESNTTMSLNVTVQNEGDVTEQNINLQLLINDSQPVNSTIDQLAPEKNSSFNYPWTPTDGVYNVTAYVFTSSFNSSDTKWVNVCSHTLPQPAFTVSPASASNMVTEYANITFDASNSTNPDWATITLYSWHFGSSNPPENDMSPITHNTFASTGNFTVTLTTYDSDGFCNSCSKTLIVTTNPTAAFNITSPPNCEPPLNIQGPYYVNNPLIFDAYASTAAPNAKIISYSWDFDDSTSRQSGVAVPHLYSNQSSYAVTLNVTDNNGLTGSTTLVINVIVGSPNASFTVSPSPYYINDAVSFDASGSYDPINYTSINHGITSYTWNFGDNSTAPTDKIVTHRYSSTGNYTVTMTVADYNNLTSFASTTVKIISRIPVTIEDWLTGNYTDICYDPGDTFTANVTVNNVIGLDYFNFTLNWASSAPFSLLAHGNLPLNLTGDLPLNLTDIKTSGSLFQITVASNQGLGGLNGNFTLAKIPFNVTCPGRGTLYLGPVYLLNSSGNQIPNVSGVAANFTTEAPVAFFSADKTIPAPNDLVTFDASGSYDPNHASDYHHGIILYRWDFGDGNVNETNKTTTIQHAYAMNGTYNVTLTVRDRAENSSIATPITVRTIQDVAVTDFTITAVGLSNMTKTITLFNITMNLSNKGNVNESLNVTIYENNSYVMNMSVPCIPAHNQVQAFCNSTDTCWNVTGLAGKYTICACASVTETVSPIYSTANQTLQLGKAYDLDADGKVGLSELVLMAKAFNSHGPNHDYPGESASPNWNLVVDFNGDCVVGLADLVILAQNYGK